MVVSRFLKTAGVFASGGGTVVLVHAWNSRKNRDSFPLSKWNASWDKDVIPKDVLHSPLQAEAANCNYRRTVVLVRHGQYNLDGETDTDRYLTELGKKQAALVGKRLKELHGEENKFDRLINSGMTRAKETMNIILTELKSDAPRIEDPLLNEGAPYPVEPALAGWDPSLESIFEGNKRIEQAFKQYFHRAPTSQTKDTFDLLVCHGNVIRYFVLRALQLPPEAWLRIGLRHCAMVVMSIQADGRVSLSAIDSGHIPKDSLSYF